MDETQGLILAAFEENPDGMTINEVSEYLVGMGYHTVQKSLLAMAKDGHLIQLPRRRGREIVYMPPGIFAPPALTQIRFFSPQDKDPIFEIITKITQNQEPDFVNQTKQGRGPIATIKHIFKLAHNIRLDKMGGDSEALSARQKQLYRAAMALRNYQRGLLRQLEIIDDLTKTKELWQVDTIDQVIFEDPAIPVVFPKMSDALISEIDKENGT